MSILLVGDLHGLTRGLFAAIRLAETNNEIKAIIQVGDFGYYKHSIPQFLLLPVPRVPVYMIDGNHEWFGGLNNDAAGVRQTQIPWLFHIARGTLFEIDGRKIGFMGGAESVDKKYRISAGLDWDERENITDEQFSRLDDVDAVDILITHLPPQDMIERNFDPRTLAYFGLPMTWKDRNAIKIQQLHERLNKPPLYCGHFHKAVVDGPVRILNIEELVLI